MKTGTFVVNPARSDWATNGTAELSKGLLGELIGQNTLLTPDGDRYSGCWFGAVFIDQRIKSLYYSEGDRAIVRNGTWPLEDVAEGPWRPGEDADAVGLYRAGSTGEEHRVKAARGRHGGRLRRYGRRAGDFWPFVALRARGL